MSSGPFNGFCLLTHLNKSPKMISCTIHLADIPIGFTRAPFNSWDPTLRRFIRHETFTAPHVKNTPELSPCFHLVNFLHMKRPECPLNTELKHTGRYCHHHMLTVTCMFTSQDVSSWQHCSCIQSKAGHKRRAFTVAVVGVRASSKSSSDEDNLTDKMLTAERCLEESLSTIMIYC